MITPEYAGGASDPSASSDATLNINFGCVYIHVMRQNLLLVTTTLAASRSIQVSSPISMADQSSSTTAENWRKKAQTW